MPYTDLEILLHSLLMVLLSFARSTSKNLRVTLHTWFSPPSHVILKTSLQSNLGGKRTIASKSPSEMYRYVWILLTWVSLFPVQHFIIAMPHRLKGEGNAFCISSETMVEQIKLQGVCWSNESYESFKGTGLPAHFHLMLTVSQGKIPGHILLTQDTGDCPTYPGFESSSLT